MRLNSLLRLLFISAVLLTSLNSVSFAQTRPIPSTGGNKVCNPTAEQRFSKLLDRCVVLRTEKNAVKLKQVEGPLFAYVLSNGNDVKREVFFSVNNAVQSFILTRVQHNDYEHFWRGTLNGSKYQLYLSTNDNEDLVYFFEKQLFEPTEEHDGYELIYVE